MTTFLVTKNHRRWLACLLVYISCINTELIFEACNVIIFFFVADDFLKYYLYIINTSYKGYIKSNSKLSLFDCLFTKRIFIFSLFTLFISIISGAVNLQQFFYSFDVDDSKIIVFIKL